MTYHYRDTVVQTIPLTSATDANIFIADRNYKLLSLEVAYAAAAGGALTLDLKKCTGTTAPASGASMLASPVNLNGAINTLIPASLTATVGNLRLADGDRAALDFTGSVGSLAGAVAVIVWRPV